VYVNVCRRCSNCVLSSGQSLSSSPTGGHGTTKGRAKIPRVAIDPTASLRLGHEMVTEQPTSGHVSIGGGSAVI
jgi:hypothetical protein